MTLSVLLAAAECPNQEALVIEARVLSFAELAERTRMAMTWLQAQALSAADSRKPVALVADTEQGTLDILYALFELGTPALLVHPRLTELERTRLLNEAGVTHLVDANWQLTPPPPATTISDALPVSDPERALAIVYTSGSSGSPKGVVLSRRAFAASADASAMNLGWRADDRWLLSLPLAHVGAISIVTRCLLARRAVVITQPKRNANGVDPSSLARVIERERITLLSLVPALLARLLEVSPTWNPPAHVRAMLIGGAAAAPSLLERAAERGWPVLTSYGLTEACSQVTTQRYGTQWSVQAGAGYPLPGIGLRVLDGAIQVRGPTLLSGYYPEPASVELEQGWFRTADRGYIDRSGALHVLGRDTDVLITGGENVWPSEVEHALLACTGVREACVFGTADEVWGDIIAAALVIEPGHELCLQSLMSELSSRLAPFKRPRRIALLESLPLTPSGKPDRVQVAQRSAALHRMV